MRAALGREVRRWDDSLSLTRPAEQTSFGRHDRGSSGRSEAGGHVRAFETRRDGVANALAHPQHWRHRRINTPTDICISPHGPKLGEPELAARVGNAVGWDVSVVCRRKASNAASPLVPDTACDEHTRPPMRRFLRGIFWAELGVVVGQVRNRQDKVGKGWA